MTLSVSAEDPKPDNHPVSQELSLSFPKYRKATVSVVENISQIYRW